MMLPLSESVTTTSSSHHREDDTKIRSGSRFGDHVAEVAPSDGSADHVAGVAPSVRTAVRVGSANTNNNKRGTTLTFLKSGMVRGLENYFRWHGSMVARYPVQVLIASLAVSLCCGAGLTRFREETDVTDMWLPLNSDVRLRAKWVAENFPQELRLNQIIFRAENVLEPTVVEQMADVARRVRAIRTQSNFTWEDLCFRVPIVLRPKCLQPPGDILNKTRLKRENEEDSLWADLEAEDWEEATLGDDECSSPGLQMPDLSLEALQRLPSLVKLLTEEAFSTDLARRVSVEYYPEPYCSLVQQAPTVCYEAGLLELWAEQGILAEDAARNLSLQDILDVVNTRNHSGIFMVEKDFKKFLADISYNASGHIVGAKAATITWVTRINMTDIQVAGPAQRGERVDRFTFEFEGELIAATTERRHYRDNVKVSVNVHRMFFESLERAAFQDAGMLILGYFIVFVYVFLMLGRFNWVELRFYLSVGGVMGIALGIFASYGLCSVLGLFYSAAHTVLPFMLLGIGIDDMFVIVQTYNTLTQEEAGQQLEGRVSSALHHAGVAITITSVTDFVAFAIGASSSLPILRSFCLFAGVGVLVIYFLQITWFTALLVLDQRRVEAGRNGLICCIRHNLADKQRLAQPLLQRLFRILSTWLVVPWVKVLVLGATTALLSCGLYGLISLRMEFRPEWLMDPKSEIHSWWMDHKKFFPEDGELARIYIRDVDYAESFPQIDAFVSRLKGETDIINSVDSWHSEFKRFLDESEPEAVDWSAPRLPGNWFQARLTNFLFSPRGAKYRLNFHFEGQLECGKPAPRILVSTVNFFHVLLEESTEWLSAMDRVDALVAESNITGGTDHHHIAPAFPMAVRYTNWETDKVIGRELYQNILTSGLAILFTVLLFLGSAAGAGIVFFCVAATIANVAGFMHFWGLTIDMITCNCLVISVGLCVDFSVHIAHAFQIGRGDRNSRVVEVMTRMGPAVLNGGLSTILAFILLSTSHTYIFLSFFKIFFLICIFGLYHGLIVLPVVLSLVGPLGPQGEGREEEEGGLDDEREKLTQMDSLFSAPAAQQQRSKNGNGKDDGKNSSSLSSAVAAQQSCSDHDQDKDDGKNNSIKPVCES